MRDGDVTIANPWTDWPVAGDESVELALGAAPCAALSRAAMASAIGVELAWG